MSKCKGAEPGDGGWRNFLLARADTSFAIDTRIYCCKDLLLLCEWSVTPRLRVQISYSTLRTCAGCTICCALLIEGHPWAVAMTCMLLVVTGSATECGVELCLNLSAAV
jgi:hypothetical protein